MEMKLVRDGEEIDIKQPIKFSSASIQDDLKVTGHTTEFDIIYEETGKKYRITAIIQTSRLIGENK